MTLQGLHSTLEGKPGRVSVTVCNTDLSEALSTVEGGLRDAERPYVVVYAGQPDQVRITDFLTPTLSVAFSTDHPQSGLFFYNSSSMILTKYFVQALERPAARSLKATESSNAQDLCDRKCRIQASILQCMECVT